MSDAATRDKSDDVALKLVLVVAATAALLALVLAHVTGTNGSAYHLWVWRRIDAVRIWPIMLLAGAPAIVAHIGVARRGWRVGAALPLVAASTFLMSLAAAGVQREPFDLVRIAEVVEHPLATSYFTDAQILAAQPDGLVSFLRDYPSLLEHFSLHSRQKPPGPMLYYWGWIKLLAPPPQRAAMAGGAVLGLLAAAGVFAVYAFAKLVSRDARPAFVAATWFALMPATSLFFPTFDAFYPILTCAIAGAWLLALRTGRIRWAAAFAAALSVALFFSFSLLVLGALLVGWGAMTIIEAPREGAKRFAVASLVGLGVVASVYVILWLTTGFNLPATFLSALRNQEMLESWFVFPRPYPQTIPSDVQDFFLGSGWISLPVLIFWLLRRDVWRQRRYELIGLATIAVVAATGLLAAETARVWLFLQPLVMIPLGLELSRWPGRAGAAVLVCLLLLTIAVAQNMTFLLP